MRVVIRLNRRKLVPRVLLALAVTTILLTLSLYLSSLDTEQAEDLGTQSPDGQDSERDMPPEDLQDSEDGSIGTPPSLPGRPGPPTPPAP